MHVGEWQNIKSPDPFSKFTPLRIIDIGVVDGAKDKLPSIQRVTCTTDRNSDYTHSGVYQHISH